MPHTFATYTEASLNAFKFNPRSQELIDRKKEILNSIIDHSDSSPKNMIFFGFSPLMLVTDCEELYLTEAGEETKNFLDKKNIKYTYIDEDDLTNHKKKFSWAIATDEYFTFANSEDHQLGKVQRVADLVKDVIVTTFKDYKNQDFRDKEFSQPLAVRHGLTSKVFLEHHDYDYDDRNSWKTRVYEMQDKTVNVTGPFNRRSMYFKQMAKFSMDAGAKSFYVHKNLMYKSLIKKNYEHVISISF